MPATPNAASAPRDEVICVIFGGWHTELGLPLAEIRGPLAGLKPEFPNARYLVFGWGARDYYMARNPDIGDILRALAPGPAVMLVIPLQIPPAVFFGASNVFLINVSRNGIERLSELLWNYLAANEEGPPRSIGTGPDPQSVFYASAGTYNLSHTCNTWTAEALRVAGLPVSAAGVVFAVQVLDQLPPLLAPATKLKRISANFISLRENVTVQEGVFRPTNPSTASGSSSMASASLNLLKKPQSAIRKVSSTSCASVKY